MLAGRARWSRSSPDFGQVRALDRFGVAPPRPLPIPVRHASSSSKSSPSHARSIVVSLRTWSDSTSRNVRVSPRTCGGDWLDGKIEQERLIEKLVGQAGRRPCPQVARQLAGIDPVQPLRRHRPDPQVRALRDADIARLLAGAREGKARERDPRADRISQATAASGKPAARSLRREAARQAESSAFPAPAPARSRRPAIDRRARAR